MDFQSNNQKEIDYRLRLYAHDALQKTFRKLLIITVDLDIVAIAFAIALYHFFKIYFKKLSVELGNDEL